MTKALDGTLAAVVKEITRLHSEILLAARTSVEKAVRIGELLSRARSSRKGKWLLWLKDNVPFSDQTARNYIRVYDRRDDPQFKNVLNLSDAYTLLCAPGKTGGTSENARRRELENVSPAIPAQSNGEAVAPRPESAPLPQPARLRRRSKDWIMDQISTENLNRALEQSQIEIDKQLSEIIAQISRQDRTACPEFSANLIAHGKALIQQGERLRDPSRVTPSH